jgi:histidinol-phosphate aminotransferase
MATLHRRDWLKQSSLAFAGFSLTLPASLLAAEKTTRYGSTGQIKLSANESPYGPSLLARKAMSEAIINSNRYPWDVTTQLREKIAAMYGFDKEFVVMGAGSSDILGVVTQLASLQKGNAISADPTFSTWATAAERLGLQIIRVPLTADKRHDLRTMLSRLNSNTRLFYICNPNNPTGTLLPSAEIRDVALEASKQCLVLLDEAYLEYTSESSLAGLVSENKNIIVVKTFSKIYGLAGARIGYAIAHPDTINRMTALQPWSNAGTSAVSLAAALASLDDETFLANSKKWNREANDFTEKELQSIGLSVIPSHTNFIYYSLGNFKGNWQEMLKEKNIITGRITEQNGQWTRTTIGTLEEMRQFIQVAKAII